MNKFDLYLIYGYKIKRNRRSGYKNTPPAFFERDMVKIAKMAIRPEEREWILSEGENALDINDNPYVFYSYIAPDEFTPENYQEIMNRLIEHQRRVLWLEGFYSHMVNSGSENCLNCGKLFKPIGVRTEFCTPMCKREFYKREK